MPFPTPEGPEIMRGRVSFGGSGAILVVYERRDGSG